METEILRGNFSEIQALQIRREEQARGNRVNIRRLDRQLLEIEIVHCGSRLIHGQLEPTPSTSYQVSKALT